MVEYKIIAVLCNIPKELFEDGSININLTGYGKNCKGLIKPTNNLTGSHLLAIFNNIESEIPFRNEEQRLKFQKQLKESFIPDFERMNPLAILQLEDFEVDNPENIKLEKYILNHINNITLTLSFNYSSPIEIFFFLYIDKKTKVIEGKINYPSRIDINLYEKNEKGILKNKEPNSTLSQKISLLFTEELKNKKENDDDFFIIKALERYRIALELKDPRDRIPEFWSIFNILANNSRTEGTRKLFEKYLIEELKKVDVFSEVRAAWYHFKKHKKGFNLDEESKNMRICVEKILLKMIDEYYSEIINKKD